MTQIDWSKLNQNEYKVEILDKTRHDVTIAFCRLEISLPNLRVTSLEIELAQNCLPWRKIPESYALFIDTPQQDIPELP